MSRLKDSRVSGTPGSAGSAKSTTPTRTTTATKGLVAYQDPDAGMSDEDRESGIIPYFLPIILKVLMYNVEKGYITYKQKKINNG